MKPGRKVFQTALPASVRSALLRLANSRWFVVLFYSLLFTVFFSPAIVRGYLLAVGADGQNLYLPNYHARKVLWDPLIFAGFPMLADPQVMSWYPPSLLLSLIPGTWNLFILLAYVAASSFMYGYVFTLTKSRFAGLFSGLVFGMSGFMMAHLGHAVIIHSVAWLPLLIWSLEQLRLRWSPGWFVAGSAAVALSFLGGHTQIFAYGMLLSGAYALTLGWSSPVGRWRYYLRAALVVLLGMSFVAIQIVPTAEIVGQSARVGYKYSDFVSHALPPLQALMLVFPNVFGALPASGAVLYYGADNLTELTGYVGLPTLLLAAIGFLKWRPRVFSVFWLCAGLLGIVLAMGDATPLARIIYHVPILNQFRAPGRHLLEFTFAASVLSGLGVAFLTTQRFSKPLIIRTVLIGSVVMLVCVIIVFVKSDSFVALAAHKDLPPEQVLSWTKRAVAVPLVLFALAAAALFYWHQAPTSTARRLLLLFLVAIDLSSFGWFYDWQYTRIDSAALMPSEIAVRYKNLLAISNQRILPIHGTLAPRSEIPPNLSRLWGVPNASGYNTLILSRFNRMTSILDVGSVTRPLWLEPRDLSLNLMAVRYLFMPSPKLTSDEGSTTWLKDDMQLALGSGCIDGSSNAFTFNLPQPVSSSSIAIVSRLACSSQIPDGSEIVRVKLTDVTGKEETKGFVAGRDASEWAYDCLSLKPQMKHRRAQVFSTFPVKLYEEDCVGHSYLTKLNLERRKDITRVEFEWVGNSGSMILDKLTLIDEAAGISTPADPMTVGSRWRFVEETDGARVYENLTVMPRVWLVPGVNVVKEEEALLAVQTSKLPDGHHFDPTMTALVEEPVTLAMERSDPEARVNVASMSDRVMEVHTSSSFPAFLVTSDVYYPGWRVSIDGQEARIYRADYALRGVAIPAGQHVVKFEYGRRRFFFGVVMSLLSLAVLGALVLVSVRGRGTRPLSVAKTLARP